MTWWWRENGNPIWAQREFLVLSVYVCVTTCLPLLYLHNFSYFTEHSLYDCLRTETDGGGRLMGWIFSTWKTLGKYKACILCAFELPSEIWFLLLQGGWISVFTTTLHVYSMFYRCGFTVLHINTVAHNPFPKWINFFFFFLISQRSKIWSIFMFSMLFQLYEELCSKSKRVKNREQQDNRFQASQAHCHHFSRGVLAYR